MTSKRVMYPLSVLFEVGRGSDAARARLQEPARDPDPHERAEHLAALAGSPAQVAGSAEALALTSPASRYPPKRPPHCFGCKDLAPPVTPLLAVPQLRKKVQTVASCLAPRASPQVRHPDRGGGRGPAPHGAHADVPRDQGGLRESRGERSRSQ